MTQDQIQLAIDALSKINDTIYAQGAPLGSDRYFDLRKTCVDTILELRAIQTQPAAAHGVEGLEDALEYFEITNWFSHLTDDENVSQLAKKACEKVCMAARLYAQSAQPLRGECPNSGKPCSCTNENNCVTQEQPLPADKQAAFDAVDEIESYFDTVDDKNLGEYIKTIRAALTAPQPVADLEGLKKSPRHPSVGGTAQSNQRIMGWNDCIEHIQSLHATGWPTTSADVQELKDAVIEQGAALKKVMDDYLVLECQKEYDEINAVVEKHAPTIAKVKGV